METVHSDPASRRDTFLMGAPPSLLDGVTDPVLSSLNEASEQYRAARTSWQRDLEVAREAERAAVEELRRVRGQLDKERQRTSRHRDRAEKLASALKDLHRALFSGNVFEMILRAPA